MINFEFLWLPLGINILIMLALALLINRFILKHSYPLPIPTSPLKSQPNTLPTHLINIEEADIEKALSDLNLVVDIGSDELRKILTHLQLSSLQKNLGKLSCGDIMADNITTVGYDTTVETAWSLILDKQLKALPVLDQSQRVIGIVTRQDFLKNIKLTSYAKLEKRWLTFIKPSANIQTNKPEFIGHIMNKKVKTLTSDADISKLLPLILDEGHQQIPIVNHKGRLIGMVFENQLMTALFNQVVLNQVIS